jgi:predicted metal-dependent hydrolase
LTTRKAIPRNQKVLRSKRRTLSLHIHPDGTLIVRAPRWAPDKAIERFVRQKSSWVQKTIQKTLEKGKRAQEWRTQFAGTDEFYRGQALAVFKERCAVYAERMGVSHGRIGISNASSRWGSCSARGRLRFNWRLVMAPLEVLDYVVVHELAHLKELNHSRRFWTHVEEVMPAFREAKRWLHEYSLVALAEQEGMWVGCG